MAMDLNQIIEAAAQAALGQSQAQQSPPQDAGKGKRKGLTASRALLLGAGAFTVGRLLMGSRGRDLLGDLEQRLAAFEGDHLNVLQQDDEEDVDEDGEFDEEPEGEYEEDEEPEGDYDEEEEPEGEYDEEEEPEDEDEEDEEPEDEDDEEQEPEGEHDEEEEPQDEYDGDDEPEDEEEEEEERPRRRRRASSAGSRNGRS